MPNNHLRFKIHMFMQYNAWLFISLRSVALQNDSKTNELLKTIDDIVRIWKAIRDVFGP